MKQIIAVALGLMSITLSAQKENFKVMTYNLMYYRAAQSPCSHSVNLSRRHSAFQTVFSEADPDILLVNELGAYTDNSGANSLLQFGINVNGEQNFRLAGYSNNSFSDIVNQIFYDSTLFGLASQSHVATAVNGTSLPRVIDFYRLYYKDPGLKLGADTVFITFVSGHFKAGQGSSNELDRERAAEATMKYLLDEVQDENVILGGDLNVYDGAEAAFQTLVNYSAPAESFIDPVNLIGNWHNNGSYALVHTQSTHSSGSGCFSGGGGDDRFDFILHSKGIDKARDKVNYKQGSYVILGQDGQHFNQSINSGTNFQVSAQVANALYDFSDHLPVLAEYEITPSGLGQAEAQLPQQHLQFNNPVREHLSLNRVKDLNKTLKISIQSLSGQKLRETQMNSGQSELRINTAHWKNGVYLLMIEDHSGHTSIHKLMK